MPESFTLLKQLPSVLEGVWILLFLKTQFQIKIRQKWIVWICTPIVWSGFVYIMAWFQIDNIIYKSLLGIGLTILWESLFYSGTVLHKIFTALIANPLLGVFDVLGIEVFQVAFHADFEVITESFPVAIVIKAAAIAAILLFGLVLKNKEKSQLQMKEWILLILFVGLIFSVMLNIAREDITRKIFSQENIFNELALLILLYLVFYIIQSMSHRHALEQERAILQQQVEEEERSVQALAETHQAIRRLSHDFRDHVVSIRSYLEQGEQEAALRYVCSISEKADHAILPVHTNNIALDAILNEKYLLGMQKNISFQFAVNDLSNIPISDIDAVTIVANALNNAIEACAKVSKQKWIYIQMGVRNDSFIISVKNPVEESVSIVQNQISTTKEDKLRHGIGLSNVQTVVTQNHGYFSLSCQDEIFHFLVLFDENEVNSLPISTF